MNSEATVYDVLAPAYDLLTAGHAYGRWLASLERLALDCGLRGRRVLDVACGTGKSFVPLQERGYEITACDLSPGMVQRARRKATSATRLHVADMRELPRFGEFDLVTCLDDAINHLLTAAELRTAFDGLARNLAPEGLLLFDINTPLAYTGGDVCVEDADHMVVWRGSQARLAYPGDETDLVVDVFTRNATMWERAQGRQRHRHHPLDELLAPMHGAGLEVRAVRGQRPGAILDDYIDESQHHKLVVVAGRVQTMFAGRRWP